MRAATAGQGLAKFQRLIKPAQFQAVYRLGRKAVGRTLILWSLPAETGGIRVGVVASLKVGDSVRRNRARRLLREAFRQERAAFSGPADVVLVARRSPTGATLAEVKADLLQAARRTGLLPPDAQKKDAS